MLFCSPFNVTSSSLCERRLLPLLIPPTAILPVACCYRPLLTTFYRWHHIGDIDRMSPKGRHLFPPKPSKVFSLYRFFFKYFVSENIFFTKFFPLRHLSELVTQKRIFLAKFFPLFNFIFEFFTSVPVAHPFPSLSIPLSGTMKTR